MGWVREMKSSRQIFANADNEYPLTLLRHAIVGRVQEANNNIICQATICATRFVIFKPL